jgi:hypothetical protein
MFALLRFVPHIAIGLAALFIVWKAYDFGADSTHAKWVVKHNNFVMEVERAKAAELARQEEANRRARKEQDRIVTNLELQSQQLEEQLAKLNEEALNDPNANACGISPRSVRRLNQIRDSD